MAQMRLEDLVDPSAAATAIGGGFGFTEGPVWVPAEGCLLFNDIPGDARWRWTAARGMELVTRPTCKANGMCLDNDGHVIVCEHISSSVTRLRGEIRETIAFHHGGRYLNSPNDVVTRRSDGSIYFSDPAGGREFEWIGLLRPRDLPFQGVYRIPPGGGPVELVVPQDEYVVPNGLCFSPDESLLYINDTARKLVNVYDVAPDGSLGNARTIVEGVGTGQLHQANLDGMKCDEHGNVWVTGPGGILVLSPRGEPLGTVAIPEVTSNLCWGGADGRTLFVTSSTTVHMLQTRVGSAVPQSR
jgi:gluconolactonase